MVASACNGGDGDARRAKGILDLRRRITLAGTEYLLLTLWSVSDAVTDQFMELGSRGRLTVLLPQPAELGELRLVKGESGVAALEQPPL